MNELTALILKHGVGFVFLNVLLEQLGIPVPAVPTLLVAGEKDQLLPPARAQATRMLRSSAQDRAVSLPTGHVGMIEAPVAFATALEAWLNA